MNPQPRVCQECGIVTRNIGKHKRRARCSEQHIRKEGY